MLISILFTKTLFILFCLFLCFLLETSIIEMIFQGNLGRKFPYISMK